MRYPPSRAGDDSGPVVTRATTSEQNTDDITVAPAADIPRDPARWLRLHHRLYRRPRWSRELDRLLSTSERSDVDGEGLAVVEVDYDGCGLHLGVPEREYRGRELAAAGVDAVSAEAVTAEFPCDASASVTHDRTCDRCRYRFVPSRSDARYCGPACRQAAYRERSQQTAPTRIRRPIAESWRTAARDLRRAAQRLDRLMGDERFARNLAKLHDIGAADILAASQVVGAYSAVIRALPRKARRTAVRPRPVAVTSDAPDDGSGAAR